MNYTIHRAEEDPAYRKKVAALLAVADVGVREFSIETKPIQVPPEVPEALRKLFLDSTHKEVRTQHLATDGQARWFDLDDESVGTRALFALAGPWIDAVSEGRTIVVDEIWALHPTLLRHLIEMVHRAPGAQVILTTHDTNLLDLDLVRRDQVFFVEKDSSGRAFLFSLLDYRARKGEAIGKGYLAGRYGALPFLEDYSVG